MYEKNDINRLLHIYKNEVKKNLKRKYKVSGPKADLGMKKYGFEKDFLEYIDDYQFVEPERIAIEVYEDVLEDNYIFKVNGKYVLGKLKKEANKSEFGVRNHTNISSVREMRMKGYK